MTARFVLVIVLSVASGLTTLAQTVPAPPDQNTPAFEVTSVKVTPPRADRSTLGTQPGGRFSAIAMPVIGVITEAYGVLPSQVVGGPRWIYTDEFDVIAKAAEGTPPPAVLSMLRRLLADRFTLKAHVEQRELPIYALETARPGAAPKLPPAATNCESTQADAAAHAAPAILGADTKKDAPDSDPCREQMRVGFKSGNLLVTMVKPGTTMTGLAGRLSGYFDRPVVDRTGLTGVFDVSLEFDMNKSIVDDTGGASAPRSDRGPSLFTALQEQLGLRLRSTRGAVDVLVIDSIDRPSPD
jgi:uncharacterized protein (TIGR03435 family)